MSRPESRDRARFPWEGSPLPVVPCALALVALCIAPLLLSLLGFDFALSEPGVSDHSASGVWHSRGRIVHHLIEWTAVSAAITVSLLAFAQARIAREPLLLVLAVSLLSAGMTEGLHKLVELELIPAPPGTPPHAQGTCDVWSVFYALLLLGGTLGTTWTPLARAASRIGTAGWVLLGGAVLPVATLAIPLTSLLASSGVEGLPLAPYLACALLWLRPLLAGGGSRLSVILLLSLVPAVASELYVVLGSDGLFDHAHTSSLLLETVAYGVPAIGLVVEYRVAYEAQAHLARDLEEQRFQLDQSLAQALHDARHDKLTGLPNRSSLLERLAHAVAHARRYSHPIAVILVDLDRFQQVNDTLGHDVGDDVLRQIAWRLARASRESDVVGRFGGDVFALLLYGAQGESDASITAGVLRRALEEPVRVQGSDLVLSSTQGIAFYPIDAEGPEELVRRAELALASAKEAGGARVQFYEPSMQQASQNAVEIERELRLAIDRKEFVLYYQPQVDLETQRIVGAEALLRWDHPERGMVPPLDFLPIAERTGLIVPIGAWVIEAVCSQRALWTAQEIPSFPISLNVSAEQFRSQPVSEILWQALERMGLDGSEIHCEVTESCMIRNPEKTREQLRQLRELGVRIALDDFGTGYSSLSTLNEFPIDVLKIDRSFVRRMGSERKQLSIVSAIVALAESLGLDTVAEGIESAQELALLRDLGCAKAQGYYFAKPLPADELATWAMARLGKG